MTDAAIVTMVAQVVGPFVSAGAGCYFGLKGAINGLKERSIRMEGRLESIDGLMKEASWSMKRFTEDYREQHKDQR